MDRRRVVGGLLVFCAPAIIRTPRLLMPIRGEKCALAEFRNKTWPSPWKEIELAGNGRARLLEAYCRSLRAGRSSSA